MLWSAVQRSIEFLNLTNPQPKMVVEIFMIWVALSLLLAVWGLGLTLHIGGSLVHVFLILAFLVLFADMLSSTEVRG